MNRRIHSDQIVGCSSKITVQFEMFLLTIREIENPL
jgi:hypothetical protein